MKAIQLLVKSLAGTILFFLVLFFSAGHFNYWQGWLYTSINLLVVIIGFLTMQNTELVKERLKPGSGAKLWDLLFITLLMPTYIIILIIAGLDYGRYHWSPDFHWCIFIVGIVLTIIGQLVFFIAKKQNHFFSSVVRIQTERGHTVCKTGLYKFVRHPGYFGQIVSAAGLPLLLGSLWCIIPSVLYIVLVLIRTYFEDKTLTNELNGYLEYTNSTRYKIIWGVW